MEALIEALNCITRNQPAKRLHTRECVCVCVWGGGGLLEEGGGNTGGEAEGSSNEACFIGPQGGYVM